MVETGIMAMRGYEVAQKYVRYRYKRELTRKSNTTDNGILSLLDNINEEVTVVLPLCKIIRIMEMDNALLMGPHDLLRQQHTAG